ncbi:MAG: recombinase family protein, partial [Bacillota bacterium]|nr:recombinase family protein [Bacillota bacterium]
VSMAFDMYVNGGLGCQLIADAFTNAGLKPKKSDGTWARSTIRKILKNPVYTGEICWNKFRSVRKKKTDEKNTQIPNNKSEWIVVKNDHPAIIDAETFAHAQEIMESRAHSAYFTGEFINPLAGLIYCSACGGLMQRQHLKSREKFPRLYCRTKGCSRGVRLEYVETAVTEALNSVLSGFSGKLKSTVPMDNSKIIQRYSLELDKSRLQKDKLHDLLEQGVYSPEVFVGRKAKLSALEAELRALIASLKKEPGDYQNTCRPGEIKLSAEYFSQLGDPNQKNAILKALVKKIIFTRGKDYPKNKFDLTIILKGL